MTIEEVTQKMIDFQVKQGGPAFENDNCLNWIDEYDENTECCVMGCVIPMEYREFISKSDTATTALFTLKEHGYKEFMGIDDHFFTDAQDIHDTWARNKSVQNRHPDWTEYVTTHLTDLLNKYKAM